MFVMCLAHAHVVVAGPSSSIKFEKGTSVHGALPQWFDSSCFENFCLSLCHLK